MGIYDIHRPYFVFELLLLLRGKWGQNVTPVFMAFLFFFNLMEEEFCTKFYGVLISFHEVIKLQSFEFGVTDVIPANVKKMFTPGFLCIFLLLAKENVLWSFWWFFRKIIKLRRFEWLNCLNVSDVIYANEHT